MNRRVHAHCKACSDILLCARSKTRRSSLASLTLTLVRAILLMRLQAVNLNNCSSFQIQLGMSHFHSQSLSSSFHWTSVCFHGPQHGRIPLDYKPLTDFRSVVNCCAASVASEQQHKQDLTKIYRRGDEFSN